jgi:phosphatidate cytidylyltransferase
MKNILLRALTGSIFVILIIGSLWFPETLAPLLMVSLFLWLGLLEYFNLFKNNATVQVSPVLGTAGSLGVFFLLVASLRSTAGHHFLLFSLVFPLLFLFFLLEIWRKKENPLLNIGVFSFGIFYLVLPFFLILVLTSASSIDDPLAIGMFLLIWTNDTFAYLSGRFLGKTKLFERISPKKTWEGTLGGVFFTLLAGYFMGHWGTGHDHIFWIISAGIVAPCAIFGDLLESLFKRSFTLKDSGSILPGHGGILDRFDATLLTVPFFYSWTIIYDYFCR